MMIPVVFICDEAYAVPTSVAITSLRENADLKKSQYTVYVIGIGISESNKQKILSLSKDGFAVKVSDMVLTDKQQEVSQIRERVTTAALMKFELPNIFQQYDKILYLDSDVLVLRDLSELYQTSIENVYAGVVKDVMTYTGRDFHLKSMEYPWENYFNSGMLLLNLDMMRQEQVSEKLLDYRLHGKNYFMDQDALNVVLGGYVKYLDPNYNLLNCFFEWFGTKTMSRFYGVSFPQNRYDVYRQATVLHLGDKIKPWRYDMPILSELYQEYYQKSPYAAEPLHLLKPKKDTRPLKYRLKYLLKRWW